MLDFSMLKTLPDDKNNTIKDLTCGRYGSNIRLQHLCCLILDSFPPRKASDFGLRQLLTKFVTGEINAELYMDISTILTMKGGY